MQQIARDPFDREGLQAILDEIAAVRAAEEAATGAPPADGGEPASGGR